MDSHRRKETVHCDIHKPITLKIFFTIISIPLLIIAVAEFQGPDLRSAFHNSILTFFSFPSNRVIFSIFSIIVIFLFFYIKPMICVWHDQVHGRTSTDACRDQAMRRLNRLSFFLGLLTVLGFIAGGIAELHFDPKMLSADNRVTFFMKFMQSLSSGLFAAVLMNMSLSDLLFPVKRAIVHQGTSVIMRQDSYVRKVFKSLFSMVFFIIIQMSLITFDFMEIGRDLFLEGNLDVTQHEPSETGEDPGQQPSFMQRITNSLPEALLSHSLEHKKDINPGRFFRHEKIRDSFKVLLLRFILYYLLAFHMLSLLKRELRNPLATVSAKLRVLSDEGKSDAADLDKKICGMSSGLNSEQIEIVANDEFAEIFKSINILLSKRREEIQLNQDRLRKIIDSAADPILSFDTSGKIFIFNPAAEAYFGKKREEISDVMLKNLFTTEEIEKCGCGDNGDAFVDYLVSDKQERRRFSGKGRDKTLNFEANISTTMTPEGPIHTAILRDINAQLEFEENLKRSKIEAEKANRLKSEFLANMSHELRTPLNAILGFTQLMVSDRNLTDDQKDKIRIISRSGEHLLGLINDILDISKIEAGKAELHISTFSLHRFLRDIYEMFTLRCEKKGLSLDMELLDGTPEFVEGDIGKLRQVLINLVGNAVKFTEEGGITIVAGPDEGGLKFAVTDTGIGIDGSEIERILEPFVQSNEHGTDGGTGLGLAISSRYISMMGGKLTISSRRGQGSAFSFVLNMKTAAASEKISENIQIIIGIRGNMHYKILIVDDKQNNRMILKEMLERAGFIIQEASDGKEALAAAVDFRPDIIFMDIRMPVMDGYEAAAAIRADSRLSDCTLFALTASAFKHDETRIINAGFDGYLAKPFKMNTLFSLISEKTGIIFDYESRTQQETVKIPAEPDYAAAAATVSEVFLTAISSALEINDFVTIRRIVQDEQLSGEAAIFAVALIAAADLFDDVQVRYLIDRITEARG